MLLSEYPCLYFFTWPVCITFFATCITNLVLRRTEFAIGGVVFVVRVLTLAELVRDILAVLHIGPITVCSNTSSCLNTRARLFGRLKWGAGLWRKIDTITMEATTTKLTGARE